MQFWRFLFLVVPASAAHWNFFGPSVAKKNLLAGNARRPAAAESEDTVDDAVVFMQQGAAAVVGQPQKGKPENRGETASKKKNEMREQSLIKSLKGVGGSSMSCVSKCRYGEVRHGWRECLEQCVENGLLRATLLTMLPEEHHDPLHPELEMPTDLKAEMKKRQNLMARMRSAEL